MKSTRTSWQAKLDRVQEWKVGEDNPRYPGKMLIPTPRQIDGLVNEIPPGAVSNLKLMRKILAARCGADVTCPLCTGMFLRIAAEAADERRQAGDGDVTPYWRVVDDKGRHNPKFPGGVEAQAAWLQDEVASQMAGG